MISDKIEVPLNTSNSALPNPLNSQVETKGRFWQSLKLAFRETYQQGRLWEPTVKIVALAVAVAVSVCFASMLLKGLAQRAVFIGKQVVLKTFKNNVLIHTSSPYIYTKGHYFMDVIIAGLMGTIFTTVCCAIPAAFIYEDPFFANFKKAYNS